MAAPALRWAVAVVLAMTAGVSVLNLGPDVSFIEEEFSLPTIIQGGVSYALIVPSLSGGFLVSGEFREAKDRDSSFLVGVEYQHMGLVSLGFGYRYPNTSPGPAFRGLRPQSTHRIRTVAGGERRLVCHDCSRSSI